MLMIPRRILSTPLMRRGGYQVVCKLFAPEIVAALKQEAVSQQSLACETRVRQSDTESVRGGDPAQSFSTRRAAICKPHSTSVRSCSKHWPASSACRLYHRSSRNFYLLLPRRRLPDDSSRHRRVRRGGDHLPGRAGHSIERWKALRVPRSHLGVFEFPATRSGTRRRSHATRTR